MQNESRLKEKELYARTFQNRHFCEQASAQWREALTALLQQAARAAAVGLIDLSASSLLSSLPQQTSGSQTPSNGPQPASDAQESAPDGEPKEGEVNLRCARRYPHLRMSACHVGENVS